MNRNKSNIVDLTTKDIQSQQLTIGTPITPSFTPHSYDFRNLISHVNDCAIKCENLPDRQKLFVIKSKKLASNEASLGQWNDQHIIETLNSYSMHKSSILQYRAVVSDAVGAPAQEFFKMMQNASKNILDSLLNVIVCTEGAKGVLDLKSRLNIIPYGSFEFDVLRCYNIIIYSTPFIIMSTYERSLLTPEVFFNAPYEHIATNLVDYITNHPPDNSSILLRMQIKLENSLPQIGLLRDAYEAYLEVSRKTKLFGVVSLIPVTFKYFVLPISNVLWSQLIPTVPAITDAVTAGLPVSPAVIPDVPALSPEDLNRILSVIMKTFADEFPVFS